MKYEQSVLYTLARLAINEAISHPAPILASMGILDISLIYDLVIDKINGVVYAEAVAILKVRIGGQYPSSS